MVTRHRTAHRSSPTVSSATVPAFVLAGLAAGVLGLSACGDDAGDIDPTEADTGIPLNVGSEEPAVSPEPIEP